MEGANLSGDLKDPAKSIPSGTIAAIGSAIVVYCALVVTMGASFPRATLKTNMNAMQEACVSKYVVVVGVLISSISSALGSLFGEILCLFSSVCLFTNIFCPVFKLIES